MFIIMIKIITVSSKLIEVKMLVPDNRKYQAAERRVGEDPADFVDRQVAVGRRPEGVRDSAKEDAE